ncbi:MAG: twin-arginine translocase subunit TatB [Alphaproteobacteria bacterium]|nr:MAG: twin-arginine translocase subunit TatB [Alphaproteobacteria bacterium]
MFDIGWTELLLIAIVALIVVGPQDLPRLFRQLGRWSARIRAMASDFQHSLEEAARESGVRDVTEDLGKMTSSRALGLDEVERSARELMDQDWDDAGSGAGGGKDSGAGSGAGAEDAERAERTRRIAEAMAAERAEREAEIAAKAAEAEAKLAAGGDGKSGA